MAKHGRKHKGNGGWHHGTIRGRRQLFGIKRERRRLEGDEVPASWHRKYVSVDAPLDKIPLFLRGGYILPTQALATTTTWSRLNPFGLIIALDGRREASGSLFWDDGDSIDSIKKEIYFLAKYIFSEGQMRTKIVKNGYQGVDSLIYNTVQVLGVTSRPNAIVLNGNVIRGKDLQYQENGKLTLQISVPLTDELNIILQQNIKKVYNST